MNWESYNIAFKKFVTLNDNQDNLIYFYSCITNHKNACTFNTANPNPNFLHIHVYTCIIIEHKQGGENIA